MKEITIYSSGLCYCSVCADKDLSVEYITEYINVHSPTGIKSKWEIDEYNFKDGTENPHICEQDKNKKHYLFSC